MLKVKADQAKNLLTMTFSGHVTPEEMKAEDEKIKTLLAGLQPGFRLLTDLTPLESMDPACRPYISRNMDQFSKKDISKVVRVIPDPRKDIGLNILSVFHYPRRTGIVTCKTLAEAAVLLGE